MVETTERLGLPMLIAGQGQKDLTHNEALLGVDLLLHASALSRTLVAAPGLPGLGDCWLIPGGAGGVWADHADELAGWTSGGWRYQKCPPGARVWIADEELYARRTAGGWIVDGPHHCPASAVALPSGGSTVDGEARAAIAALIQRLRAVGVLAG